MKAHKRSRLIMESEILGHHEAAGRQDWRALTEGIWEVRKIPPPALHKVLASFACSSSSQIPNSFPERWWARTSNSMLINCSTSGYTKASFLLLAEQGKNLERILVCQSSLLQDYKKRCSENSSFIMKDIWFLPLNLFLLVYHKHGGSCGMRYTCLGDNMQDHKQKF